MKCLSECELEACVDGRATAEMERHLRDCDACRVEVETILSICRALDDLEPDSPPHDLAPAILMRLRSTPPSLCARLEAIAWLGSATTAGFLIAGYVMSRVAEATASLASSLGAFPALLRLGRGILADAGTTVWVMFRIPQAAMACAAIALAAAGFALVFAGLRRAGGARGDYEEEIA